jgi:hypothetical protein
MTENTSGLQNQQDDSASRIALKGGALLMTKLSHQPKVNNSNRNTRREPATRRAGQLALPLTAEGDSGERVGLSEYAACNCALHLPWSAMREGLKPMCHLVPFGCRARGSSQPPLL